jgi:hypothetical protein
LLEFPGYLAHLRGPKGQELPRRETAQAASGRRAMQVTWRPPPVKFLSVTPMFELFYSAFPIKLETISRLQEVRRSFEIGFISQTRKTVMASRPWAPISRRNGAFGVM